MGWQRCEIHDSIVPHSECLHTKQAVGGYLLVPSVAISKEVTVFVELYHVCVIKTAIAATELELLLTVYLYIFKRDSIHDLSNSFTWSHFLQFIHYIIYRLYIKVVRLS